MQALSSQTHDTEILHSNAVLSTRYVERKTADSIAAPRRNFEVDSAAPWQRAPPLNHVQVAAVRAAWHQWWPSLRAPGGETPLRAMLLTWCLYCCTGCWYDLDRQRYTVFWPHTICRPNTKTKINRTSGQTQSVFFFLHVAIRNSLRSNNKVLLQYILYTHVYSRLGKVF